MTSKTSQPPIGAMRPFADLLLSLDKGRVLDEASARLAEVVRAVMEADKKGSVTIKVTVSPRQGAEVTVEVEAVTTAVVPKPDHAGVFFVTDKHELTRDDPSYESPLIRYKDAEKGDN